jgi:hypothetical protein
MRQTKAQREAKELTQKRSERAKVGHATRRQNNLKVMEAEANKKQHAIEMARAQQVTGNWPPQATQGILIGDKVLTKIPDRDVDYEKGEYAAYYARSISASNTDPDYQKSCDPVGKLTAKTGDNETASMQLGLKLANLHAKLQVTIYLLQQDGYEKYL